MSKQPFSSIMHASLMFLFWLPCWFRARDSLTDSLTVNEVKKIRGPGGVVVVKVNKRGFTSMHGPTVV